MTFSTTPCSSRFVRPPPPPFWIEWSFSSSRSVRDFCACCDGSFVIKYLKVPEGLNLFGDGVISFEGGDVLRGLEINQFHTYRFESADGFNYCFFVDGRLFYCRVGNPDFLEYSDYLQMYGQGGCQPAIPPTINKWDHVRYGRISRGELIVSTDPPSGVVDADVYPRLDRFTVTFDAANYMMIDEIAVSVTGGPVPAVTKTRRPDNGPPEVVEVVLDRPLQFGVTTTFIFSDGVAESIVAYTPLPLGACCFSSGECLEVEESECHNGG